MYGALREEVWEAFVPCELWTHIEQYMCGVLHLYELSVWEAFVSCGDVGHSSNSVVDTLLIVKMFTSHVQPLPVASLPLCWTLPTSQCAVRVCSFQMTRPYKCRSSLTVPSTLPTRL